MCKCVKVGNRTCVKVGNRTCACTCTCEDNQISPELGGETLHVQMCEGGEPYMCMYMYIHVRACAYDKHLRGKTKHLVGICIIPMPHAEPARHWSFSDHFSEMANQISFCYNT